MDWISQSPKLSGFKNGKDFKSRTKISEESISSLEFGLSAQLLPTHLLTSGQIKGLEGEKPVFYENVELSKPQQILVYILKVGQGWGCNSEVE